MPCGVMSRSDELAELRPALVEHLAPEMAEAVLEEAAQNNPAAEYIIASMLEDNNRIEDALRWYEYSAAGGHRPAVERLQDIRKQAGEHPTLRRWMHAIEIVLHRLGLHTSY